MTNSNNKIDVNKMKSIFLGKLINANNINDLVRISNQKTWKSLESNSRVRNKVSSYLNHEIKSSTSQPSDLSPLLPSALPSRTSPSTPSLAGQTARDWKRTSSPPPHLADRPAPPPLTTLAPITTPF